MNASEHRWAVILAGGDGNRLRSLTTDAHGRIVPKQYCSLNGGDPLVRDAIRRARTFVPPEHICLVVLSDHRPYWWPLGSVVPPDNLFVQPRNCGTAIGVLLAILKILDRDPFAHLLFVPADHFFENEGALSLALHGALKHVSRNTLELALIGVEAEYPASDLGYILRGARLQPGVYRVKEFIERPAPTLAEQLCGQRALWNTLLFTVWGIAALALLRENIPEIVDGMSTALSRNTAPLRAEGLAELYDTLSPVDFSRTILEKSRSVMHVIEATGCGWRDLATPQRVLRTLQRGVANRGELTSHLDLQRASMGKVRRVSHSM